MSGDVTDGGVWVGVGQTGTYRTVHQRASSVAGDCFQAFSVNPPPHFSDSDLQSSQSP